MKQLISTLALTSALTFTACTKTEKATMAFDSTLDATTEMDFNVEVVVDGDDVSFIMDGEEVEELPSGVMAHVMQVIGDENGIVVMVNGEDEENDLRRFTTDGDNMHMFVTVNGEEFITVNGEEVDGMSGDMMEYVMRMIGSEQDSDKSMQMHSMKTMAGGEHAGHHQKKGEWHSKPPHLMQGKGGRYKENEVPEQVQFMKELGLLGKVAGELDDRDAVALMGIHMIRDELDGDVRMDALQIIIKEAGPIARNAALIVAIQTMLEEGDDEAAAEYMVDLVLSN